MARKKKRPIAPLDLARLALECPPWFQFIPELMRGSRVFKNEPDALLLRRINADEFDVWEKQRIATIGVLDDMIAQRAAETRTTK